ncbi:MAG TPA: hypothetical protein VLE49_15340, partial [Anaerolineales bacterium]|nr:hypothetical protein [Anaerolineales bacterium]
MASKNSLINEIVGTVHNVNQSKIVSPIQIGKGDWENELLLFIKPEIFMVANDDNMGATVELIFEKLAEYKANIDGVMILGGALLDEKKIMDRHYGFINRLSRTASKMLSPEDL